MNIFSIILLKFYMNTWHCLPWRRRWTLPTDCFWRRSILLPTTGAGFRFGSETDVDHHEVSRRISLALVQGCWKRNSPSLHRRPNWKDPRTHKRLRIGGSQLFSHYVNLFGVLEVVRFSMPFLRVCKRFRLLSSWVYVLWPSRFASWAKKTIRGWRTS